MLKYRYRQYRTVIKCIRIIFKVLLFYHIFCSKVQCAAHVANSKSILNMHRKYSLTDQCLLCIFTLNIDVQKKQNINMLFDQRLHSGLCPIFHYTLWYYKQIFESYILMSWIRNSHTIRHLLVLYLEVQLTYVSNQNFVLHPS